MSFTTRPVRSGWEIDDTYPLPRASAKPSTPGHAEPMTTSEEPVILTANEVAKLLRVDRKTIYHAAQCGYIPHCRLGRRVIFERGAVVAWLRQGGSPVAVVKPNPASHGLGRKAAPR